MEEAIKSEFEVIDLDKEKLIDKESQKNTKKIKCLRCDSFILQANSCVYKKVEEPILLPSMQSKKDLAINNNSIENTDNIQIQTDKLDRFWTINEMLVFENIGFTNSVNNIKYLKCADCEIGPIGLQNLDNPNEFLVSIERVKYV